MKPDCTGYATKYNVRCDDGRIIQHGAFSNCDGKKVPLVYNHRHGSINDVLGNAILRERQDGVYAECYLNDTPGGKTAKSVLAHGDIGNLSILANQLVEKGPMVTKGNIREVSLVLAGANPEATIDSAVGLVVHGSLQDDESFYFDCFDGIHVGDIIEHAESGTASNDSKTVEDSKGETNEDVFNTLTDKQKNVVYELIGIAIDSVKEEPANPMDDTSTEGKNTSDSTSKEREIVKHSVFDSQSNETQTSTTYTAADEALCLGDLKRYGSLKESCIAHSITNITYAYPDAKLMNNPPSLIARDQGWVSYVMSKVHRTPFANIKSLFADVTGDDARALGYIKGKLKKEEVFTMLKRTTSPTTVYKKQKIDRDDLIDVTDFDMVGFIKSEMRLMLDEELARAFLVGDGRLASSDDKIKEANIRPIAKEEELFTISASVSGTTDDDIAKNFIRQCILARKGYKGSGQPDLFTTEDMLARMLLLTDTTGRDIYTDQAQLARKLRVNNIISVPVMEGAKDGDGNDLYGIVVNLKDYNVGADRGGAVNMFDDFDIDYNAQKYLIETRCSGALVVPYSAIILSKAAASSGGGGTPDGAGG